MSSNRNARTRLLRVLRRVARLLVVCVVLIGVTTAASASTFIVRADAPVACCCPHPDDAVSRSQCPCCRSADEAARCLPIGEASCAQPPSIPVGAAIELAVIARALTSGEIVDTDVTPLLGRLAVHRLERPPRVV